MQQLTAEGVLIKVERGRYDLVRSVRGYIVYLRDRAMRNDESGEDASLARKRAADAGIAEFELATLRRERLEVDRVDDVMQNAAQTVRTKLLTVPSKVAPLILPKMKTAEIEGVVRREIDAALAELSSMKVESVRTD